MWYDTQSFRHLNWSRIAKAAIAVGVFGLIVGGWMGWQYYREQSATLPNTPQQSDACSIWFVGSSSIHRWTSLHRDMHPWKAVNRGIDNAAFADLLPRFANSAKEPKPAAIILYAGENDIARAIPVRSIIKDLAEFLRVRREKMGDVPVLILSMKPSPGRWANYKAQQSYNAAVRRILPASSQTFYGDITTPLLSGGHLGNNYRADGVHMNASGYRIWAQVVREQLRAMLQATKIKRCDPT